MRTKTAGEGLNVRKEERMRGGKKEREERGSSTAAARHISAMRCED